MSILHTISQDEIEWQRYLDREKARLDALNWEKTLAAREARAKAAEAKAEAAEAKAQTAEAKAEAAEAKAEAAEAQGLIGQIRLCEEFLGLVPLPEDQLRSMPVEALRELLAERRGRKRG